MKRITAFDGEFWIHKDFPPAREDTVDEFMDCVKELASRLALIEDILGNDYDLDRLKELVTADKEGQCLIIPEPEDGKEFNALEPMKIGYALKSELKKLEYRKENDQKAISPLDYTIIKCLEAALKKEE